MLFLPSADFSPVVKVTQQADHYCSLWMQAIVGTTLNQPVASSPLDIDSSAWFIGDRI